MPADEVGFMLLGQSEIAEQAMRGLELKGDLPQRIYSRMDLSITAEDMTQPEFYYLRRMSSWSKRVSIGAVAAQFPKASIAAPNVAGDIRSTLAIVDRIIIRNAGAAVDAYQIGIVMTGPSGTAGVAAPTTARDDRFQIVGASATCACSLAAGNAAASSFVNEGNMLVSVGIGATLVVEGPWILSGVANVSFASRLMVEGVTVNAGLDVSFIWRERALLTSER